MALVVGFAVIVKVVVAAAPVPVVTPTGIPELAGAPVIVGERPGEGFGDARRTLTGES